MNLRLKLSLINSVLLLGVLGAATWGLFLGERAAFRDRTARSQSALLDHFSEVSRGFLEKRDVESASLAANSFAHLPGVVAATCWWQGRQIGPAIGTRSDLLTLKRDIVWANQTATVEIQYSRSQMDVEMLQSLRHLASRSWKLFTAALAVGLLASFALAAYVMDPIGRLAVAARRLSEGDLSYRLHVDRTDEFGRLTSDLNSMANRLGELDRMKKDFVANVTHELRSPLSAIESYTNQLADEVRAGRTENLPDYLTAVRNNATRLGRFINQVLNFSMVESGNIRPRFSRLKVAEAFDDVAQLFSAQFMQQGVTLAVTPSDIVLRADPDMVQQILTNLISNALKATPTGGKVTLSAERGIERIRLSVADTGPGISLADQARLFNRFEQGNEGDKKGTGLGLSIVKGLAEAQGGRAGLSSNPGQGSAFYVELLEDSHG